ncbi:MAG: S41 family peptidase [Solirubrobacterales bacterium]|nr:S41 family peptidase [Solirubrobacterales bacterium]MBV9716102.1 S41 family peptidase [Solirubrobacterales bacterium]
MPSDTARPRRARLRALIGGVLAGIVMLLAGIWLGGHPSDLPSPLRGRLFENRSLLVVNQALNVLTTRYVRPLNRSSLVDQGLSGMVASLDDPYSQYLDPRSYRERSEQSTQHLGGIGITTMPEPRGLRVRNVFEHSPAAGAGLMPGDLIIKVGAISLADRADDIGSDLIRGPAGTPVELTFLRGDAQHVISIERANIVVPVASWQIVTYHHVRIGHLKLTGFTNGSGDELRAAVRAALDAQAEALILDLRGNGGGLISEAINVASTFIAHGKILAAEERGQPRRVYMASGDAIAAHIPLVTLVDHGTASSAEIVTAALRDDGRAKVVGTQTYGKGTFQQTQSLINGGALDITIGEFFTPNGRNLGGGGARQGAGITPDVYAPENPSSAADEALAAAERTVAAEAR